VETKTKGHFRAKELSIIGIFATLTAVMAQIAIPIPFSPAPVSFGMVGVYMTAILLKPKHAVFAQVCYLLLGAVGLPVFGNLRGGIGALLGPTGGYLIVYPLMAWIVSMSLNCRYSRRLEQIQGKSWLFIKAGISMCLAHTFLYLGGTAWLSLSTNITFNAALSIAVYPFMLLDALKIVFCVAAVVPFRSYMLSLNVLLLDDATALSGDRKRQISNK